jgi:hypothetical protein
MIEHLLSKHEMRPEFRPKYHQKKKKKRQRERVVAQIKVVLWGW